MEHFNIKNTNTITYTPYQMSTSKIQIVTIPICPDLLRYDQLGEADNLRGRVVRAFFWLMRVWPV